MDSALTDTCLQLIKNARSHILDFFNRSHELLLARESTLLRELEDFESNYEKDIRCYQDELEDLEKSKQSLMLLLRNNDTLNESLAIIDRDIEKIMRKKHSSETKIVSFRWSEDFHLNLRNVGEINICDKSQTAIISGIPNYKSKSIPVITSSIDNNESKTTLQDIHSPYGLAIEPQTGKIYFADALKHCVQVYTSSGEFCFRFDNKMNMPHGICISNNLVYVSQFYGHCVNIYQLDGTFNFAVKRKENSKDQLNNPTGIAVCSTKRQLYVCDSYNHRLQIFNKNQKFDRKFGDNILKYPNDVKLAGELVIVLDENDPCVHLFDSSTLFLLSSIISRGIGKQILESWFFTIDKELNITLTDKKQHCMKTFTKSGEFITQFGKMGQFEGGLINPTGVAIDNLNRIVVVNENERNAVQIF